MFLMPVSLRASSLAWVRKDKGSGPSSLFLSIISATPINTGVLSETYKLLIFDLLN